MKRIFLGAGVPVPTHGFRYTGSHFVIRLSVPRPPALLQKRLQMSIWPIILE
jgi:hypothetical protein